MKIEILNILFLDFYKKVKKYALFEEDEVLSLTVLMVDIVRSPILRFKK